MRERARADFDARTLRAEAREALEATLDRLESGSSAAVAVLGAPGVGRSALFVEACAARSGLVSVHHDLRPRTPLAPSWFRELTAHLREQLRPQPLPAPLRAACQQRDAAPPGSEDLELAGALLEQLAQRHGRPVVLAIDNVQELLPLCTQRGGTDFWPALDGLRRRPGVGLLLGGRPERDLLAALDAREPPWPWVLLKPTEDAARLALEPLLGAAQAARLVELVGAHAGHLDRMLGAQARKPGASLEELLAELLVGPQASLGLQCELLHERAVRRSTQLAATLRALTAGELRVSELSRQLAVQSGAVVGYLERLDDLVERRPEGRYALADRLFGRWLECRGEAIPQATLRWSASSVERRAVNWLTGRQLAVELSSIRELPLLVDLAAGPTLLRVESGTLPLRLERLAVASWERAARAARRPWLLLLLGDDADQPPLLLDPRHALWGRRVVLDGRTGIRLGEVDEAGSRRPQLPG